MNFARPQLLPVLTFSVLSSIAFFVPATTARAQLGGLLGTSPKIETIETKELNALLAKQREREEKAKESGETIAEPDFVVVDVRSDKEVNVSVIPGAITKAQFEKDIEKYRNRQVIPYCTVGGRSGAYAKELVKKEFKVKNYTGSILKWIDAGLPLVTLEGKPTKRVHVYSNRHNVPAEYIRVTD